MATIEHDIQRSVVTWFRLKYRSLAPLFWPFVWAVCLIGWIAYLFGNEKKRKIKTLLKIKQS